jgi:hypothetical protein
MNRRDFIRSMLAGASVTAAGLIVPELLKPGRRIWAVGANIGRWPRVGSTDLKFDPRADGFTYRAGDTIVLGRSEDGAIVVREVIPIYLPVPTRSVMITNILGGEK